MEKVVIILPKEHPQSAESIARIGCPDCRARAEQQAASLEKRCPFCCGTLPDYAKYCAWCAGDLRTAAN